MEEKIKQIGLAFPMTPGHNQFILEGIYAYARKKPNWMLNSGIETFPMSISELKGWYGDGLIASINTKKKEQQALSLGLPLVNISAARAPSIFPLVTNDHYAMGRVAADHLLSRGLWRFVYYGTQNFWYSHERYRGFLDRLKEKGYTTQKWMSKSSIYRKVGWQDWVAELEEWLSNIETPVGVFAVHDNRARMLIDACRRMGLHVPNDVAVIGSNNDPFSCEFFHPTISSVDRNGQLCGYQMASLLDKMMSTGQTSHDNVIVPLGPVFSRESTNLLAVDNPDLTMAVRFIRTHFAEGINISDVLTRVSLSRRWLENHFKEYFGCTPHDFLCNVRVERAKQLLIETKRMTLAAIARECGFSSTRHLRAAFHRSTNMTPREYRAKNHNALPAKVHALSSTRE